MTGGVQMFDQQLFLTSRRHHIHRRRPYHLVHGGGASAQHFPEIDQNTSLQDDEETSIEELSRTSFSFSSNSSLSVPDCNKSTQQETLLYEQTSKPDKSFIILPNLKSSNVDSCRFLDFRNVIRDSINRGFHISKSLDESKEQTYTNITLPTTLDRSESVESLGPLSEEISHRSYARDDATSNAILKSNPILSNNGQQTANHKKSTNIIVKLMGLETMPQEQTVQSSISMLKPVWNSRNIVENAPWKQKEGSCLPHDKKLFLHQEDKGRKKVEDSVYKEIEGKLIELEAVKSNRDLRALKQVLDAMEEKGLLEPERNDRSYQSSPIVIMKPVSSVKRSNVSSSSSSRSSSISYNSQSQTASSKSSEKQPFDSRLRKTLEMKTSSKMMQKLDSSKPPRQQKGKNMKEISHPSSSFSSSYKNHQFDLVFSPLEDLKTKTDKVKDCHELLLNKKKIEAKNLNYPTKELLQRSEKDVSARRLKKPSINVSQEVPTNVKESTSAEQPSPVSVLDAGSVYQDSPQSPLNDNTNCCKYEKSGTKKSASMMKHKKKLESIENLLQKLDDLSTSNVQNSSTTDHIASLCGFQNPNPNHRYISQILLGSGILFQDMESQTAGRIGLHSSGCPVNPDLFMVLEQTNAYDKKKDDDADKGKMDRKLVFDLVNESLTDKLKTSSGSGGQQLIKELCGEIDALVQLQSMASRNEDCGEVVRGSKGWVNFKEMVPGLVLEIERMIFKDLIGEVLYGELDCNATLKSNVTNFISARG